MHFERLDSGLRLVVEPHGTAPVAAIWLRIGAGTAHEGVGQWGAAHFVEHMLFKGSLAVRHAPLLSTGDLGRRMDALGADLNAYTTHEETVVHCTLPAAHMTEALALVGQMCFRCRFDPDQVERERAVILDELARNRDDPSRMLGRAMARRVWPAHPYGRPVLGSPSWIQDMTVRALRAFHELWYQPWNAILVVAGAVETETVKRTVARVMTAPRPHPQPPACLQRVPPARVPFDRALGFVRLAGGFKEQLLEVGLRVPGHGHDDLPAVDMLCSALGEGGSAILPRRLHLESSLAHAAWAETDVASQGGQLVLGASPAEDDPTDLMGELGRCLWELREGGLPRASFHRARATILADRAYDDETAEGRASTLCWYTGNYGNPDAERAYRHKIAALDPRQVDAAAFKYLRPDRAVYGLVSQDAHLGQAELTRLMRPPRARRRAARRATDTRLERHLLPNGLRVMLEQVPGSSVTAMRVVGLGGSLFETPRSAGHGEAWAVLLGQGSGPLDASAWSGAIDGMSGSAGGFSSMSMAGMGAVFPSDRFSLGLPTALMPLLLPRFDEPAVDRVRASMADGVRNQRDNPGGLAWDALRSVAFPGHPYRLPSGGTKASIERLDSAAMQRFHRRFARGSNLVLAISGEMDIDATLRTLESLLGGLAEGQGTSLPSTPRQPTRRRRLLRGGWSQAHVQLGFRTVPVRHEDRPALDLLGVLLGSQGGRLFIRLREEAGLTYDVQASQLSTLQAGLLNCSISSPLARMPDARRGLERSLEELRRDPPTDVEMERARAAVTGGVALDLQRAGFRATHLAQDELLGLDGRRYRSNLLQASQVSSSQLRKVIERYLAPERALWATAGGVS